MSDSTFKERYKNLNPEQREAVDTIDGPVLVVAGPGTGKTTILTLRIAQILQKTDTPANGILAITYTDAGVKAMRAKLREVIGNRAHDVYIHTFHSFASAMIAEYPSHFVHVSDFRVMTDVEEESLIRDILTAPRFADLRPLGKTDAYISSIVRAISDSKKEALTPDMVREYVKIQIEKVKNDEENISTRGVTKGKLKAVALEELEKLDKTLLFADVYEEYENTKRTEKLQDYDDLILEFLLALRTDELFLRLIQERFLYLLVDEHQDTNDSQNFILSMIAEFFETPNIFIVGDEKQAIYRFQGASVENFLKLRKQWKDMKVISLSTNYRSHQAILDASFKMIENNYEGETHRDLRVELKSGNKEKKRPLDVVLAENTRGLEEYLVTELKRIVENEPSVTVGIITRRNRELERLLRLLESRGISVSSERSVDIFHHPVGVAFFDLLEYVNDPAQIEYLASTVASGMWGLSFSQSAELIRELKRGKLDELDMRLPALNLIRQNLLRDGAVQSIVMLAEESGFTAIVARDPAFVHVWRGIVTLAESLARDTKIENPKELISVMLAYRQSAESKTVKVSVGAPDLQIKAMTAHGSKGLEFDYVFIPYATEDAWIGRTHGGSFVLPKKSGSVSNISDIRRLFYVAVTRAKKHVTILSASEESDGRKLLPLRFITELDSENTTMIPVGRLEETETPVHSGKTVEYETLLLEEAKTVLLKSGLSVTALNHYVECPNKFLYESILKLPQAPSLSSEKGNVMHAALHNVWVAKQTTVADIEKVIVDTVSEYSGQTLLSPSDKIALKKELVDNASEVATALAPHFSAKGQVFSEQRVATFFDASHEKEKITIPIHGMLDAVIVTGDTAEIFDYKTKQAMSVAAIKGENKNQNRDYFRQLIFYKMLAEKDSRFRNKSITTSLTFVSPDDKGRCPTVTLPVTSDDMRSVEQEMQTLVSDVWNGSIITKYCTDLQCKYCGYRKLFQ